MLGRIDFVRLAYKGKVHFGSHVLASLQNFAAAAAAISYIVFEMYAYRRSHERELHTFIRAQGGSENSAFAGYWCRKVHPVLE